MNAPLARFLTRFAEDEPTLAIAFDPPPAVTLVTLPEDELHDRLAASRDQAMNDAEAVMAACVSALTEKHETALAEALADARATWVADEGLAHAALLGQAFADMRESLARSVAAALKPLLVVALVERAQVAVGQALDRILADPDHPVVTVRAPADLIESIRAARAANGALERVSYVIAEGVDISVDAGGTHVETQLAAALAAMQEI